jgi:hypothetical protein
MCPGRPERLIYVTKLAVHRWLIELLHPEAPVLLYGCGGLPSEAVCRHVRATRMHCGVPAFFLGDLDPGDLTVLLALNRGSPRLRPTREGTPLRLMGIGDSLLTWFRRRLSPGQFKKAITHMSPGELQHLGFLREVFLNLEEVVGKESMRLLESGQKIEVEGLLCWAQPGTRLREELSALLLAGLSP